MLNPPFFKNKSKKKTVFEFFPPSGRFNNPAATFRKSSVNDTHALEITVL